MEKDKKKFSKLAKILFGIATPFQLGKFITIAKSKEVESKSDGTPENTVGYENINIRYNTEVHENNFVILHVSTSQFNDITAMRDKLDKCADLGISVGLVLDTKAYDLAQIYKDVDFLQAVVKDYKIDMPVYLNIDGIMENKDLNTAQRTEIIEAFTEKAQRSDMYLGLYGKDSNLVDCNTYVFDTHKYDCFVVQDKEEIAYDGNYTLKKDIDGNISASLNLSSIITKKGLNDSRKLVYSSSYEVQEGDTYHSLALQFGLSEPDLISYNGNKKEINAGDQILIPNLYKTVDTETNTVSYTYAVARGIDISSYQTKYDWDRVKETSDYVIVQVARDPSNYAENKGSFKEVCIEQISNVVSRDIALGLYFCVSKDMKVSEYEKRLEKYFTEFEAKLAEKGIELEKDNIPVFLDFEVYYQFNDYYKLMELFEKICNEHGFTKIGIYGNKSTLESISASMRKDGERINLNETDWYVWKSGGHQYSARENTSHKDDVTLAELEELKVSGGKGFTPVMQQATNVCTDTGAANSMQHCDVSFLYDASVFGDSLRENEELGTNFDNEGLECSTVEIDLKQYPNLPVNKVLSAVDTMMSGFYFIYAATLIGKKLKIKLAQKRQEKEADKTLVKNKK